MPNAPKVQLAVKVHPDLLEQIDALACVQAKALSKTTHQPFTPSRSATARGLLLLGLAALREMRQSEAKAT